MSLALRVYIYIYIYICFVAEQFGTGVIRLTRINISPRRREFDLASSGTITMHLFEIKIFSQVKNRELRTARGQRT